MSGAAATPLQRVTLAPQPRRIAVGDWPAHSSRLLGRLVAFVPVLVLVGGAVGFVALDQNVVGGLGWPAAGVGALCVPMALLTLACQVRGRRRARRRRAAHDRLVAVLRETLELPDGPRWSTLQGLFGRLGEVQEASSSLPLADRERLLQALRLIGAHTWVERHLLGARGRHRRAKGISLLGWLGAERSIPALRATLAAGDADLAYFAAQALSQHQSRAACEVLLEALGQGWLPDARIATLLEDSRCDDAFPLIVARAGDPDARVRFWVAYLLGRRVDPRARIPLQALARDADVNVRANAAEALGHIPGSRIGAMLGDEHWLVRAHAAKAAGNGRRQELAPKLATLLRDPAWWVRQDAALALKQLMPASVSALRPVLDGDDGFARNKAAEVLIDGGYAAEQIRLLSGSVAAAQTAWESLFALARAGAVETLQSSVESAPGSLASAQLLWLLAQVRREQATGERVPRHEMSLAHAPHWAKAGAARVA